MKSVTVTGRTVEEAVQSGLQQLNVSRDRVNITVLEQPAKGLFGLIGSKEAKVVITVIPDPVEEAISFLQEVTAAMELKADITKVEEEGSVILNVYGSDMGLLIGRRGQTLDALQYLINIVANRRSENYVRIILDAEEFRKRRRKTLEELSLRLANRVARVKREIVLEPMTPQERRIIHSCLQNHPKVKTYSKGEEPNRRVVISPK